MNFGAGESARTAWKDILGLRARHQRRAVTEVIKASALVQRLKREYDVARRGLQQRPELVPALQTNQGACE